MYQHTSRNIAQVVEQFKKAKPPAVLVSPSVTTGYDFPEKECEYIVVGKIPYPDSRGALIKARQKEDSNHTAQLAMEVLVQEAGRGTRSATDRCQVFVVDDTWKWWWPKHSELAPSWFRDRILKSSLSHIPIQI
jgi:Rad3-related DNA helicase